MSRDTKTEPAGFPRCANRLRKQALEGPRLPLSRSNKQRVFSETPVVVLSDLRLPRSYRARIQASPNRKRHIAHVFSQLPTGDATKTVLGSRKQWAKLIEAMRAVSLLGLTLTFSHPTTLAAGGSQARHGHGSRVHMHLPGEL